MANTFTKIRKWAEEKGYEVKDVQGYGGKPCIQITVNADLMFEVEERDSTIYHSVRGIKGNPKGIYLSTIQKGRSGYGFHKRTQQEVIESMQDEMRHLTKVL